jgi:hypothetical protein
MKENKMNKKIVLAGLLGMLVLSACASPAVNAVAPSNGNAVSVTSSVAGAGPVTERVDLSAVAPGTLDAAERDALVFMREEEKLARDVYQTLGAKWNLPVFSNIASSEQTHMDSLKTLLDRYGVADPVATNGVGVFANADLQKLYNDLIAQGNVSIANALKVGAAIEEIDIRDLDARLAKTDNADIQLVFENLKRGSRNHLRSFTAQLKNQTGETYAPQYLDRATYDAIINGSTETGGGLGNGNSNSNTGNRGNGFRGGRR